MNNKQTIYMDKGTPKMISKAKRKIEFKHTKYFRTYE